jgi:hypothetical protein
MVYHKTQCKLSLFSILCTFHFGYLCVLCANTSVLHIRYFQPVQIQQTLLDYEQNIQSTDKICNMEAIEHCMSPWLGWQVKIFAWRNTPVYNITGQKLLSKMTKVQKGLRQKYQQCVANPKNSVVKAESWEPSAQNIIFKTMAVSTSDICPLGNLLGWGEGNYTVLTSAYIPRLQFHK